MEDAQEDIAQDAPTSDPSAEPAFADALETLRLQAGFSVLHRLLLGHEQNGRRETARISEVVVDEFGVWVIDVLSPRRAVIHGRYSDRTWSARYPEGRTEILTNPIRENDRHVGLMHELLREAGWGVTLDQVRGIVVFAGADLSELHLDSVNAARVTGVAGLGERYAARRASAAVGDLPAEQVARLTQTVAELDRSNDPAYASSHAVWTGEEPPPAASEPAVETPLSTVAGRAAADPDAVRQRIVLIAGLLLLAALAVAAVFALRGVGERPEVSAPAETPAAAPQPSSPAVPPPVTEEPVTPAKRDISLAKKRLKQLYPGHYAFVQDIDHPRVDDLVVGQITYEWDYVQKTASNAITVGKIRITLDSSGAVVGSSD
jgi:hypothetical protein